MVTTAPEFSRLKHFRNAHITKRPIIIIIFYFFILFASPNIQQQCIDHMYKSEVIPGCQRREHVPRWSELHDNPIIIQHVKSTNAIAN